MFTVTVVVMVVLELECCRGGGGGGCALEGKLSFWSNPCLKFWARLLFFSVKKEKVPLKSESNSEHQFLVLFFSLKSKI